MPHATRSRDESLREKLRSHRLALGLRQSDLATRLGTPQSFVSKYESGERKLAFLEVQRICEALGLDFLQFVKEWSDSKSHEGERAVPQ